MLTASGGPFRGKSAAELANVTVKEALCHPTWRMGPKITIDSATLMNKALEVIEARWLFGLAPERIEVLIHPESMIHSFVEFTDGSVLAQLSPPDMRLPIQYALTYPERVPGPARRLNWRELGAWHFEQPDFETFPALQLGYEVARRGGTCGAVLNAANEEAVSRFVTLHRVNPRSGSGVEVRRQSLNLLDVKNCVTLHEVDVAFMLLPAVGGFGAGDAVGIEAGSHVACDHADV